MVPANQASGDWDLSFNAGSCTDGSGLCSEAPISSAHVGTSRAIFMQPTGFHPVSCADECPLAVAVKKNAAVGSSTFFRKSSQISISVKDMLGEALGAIVLFLNHLENHFRYPI